jgi:outer membrane autotransporter protein
MLSLCSTLAAEAAVSQEWSFVVNRLVINGFEQATTTSSPVSVNGSFPPVTVTIAPSAVCVGGGALLLSSGSFHGTQATITLSGVSGCLNGVKGTGTAILNAAFPNATQASGSASSGASPNVGLNFSATCLSGCSPATQTGDSALKASTLGSVVLSTTNVQLTNIGLRLNALRGGASAGNSALTLDVDGKPLPTAAIGGLLSSLGGGASADSSSFLSRLGVFANGQGSFGNQDATSTQAGFDFNTAGLTVGADYRVIDPLILGLAFGYLRTHTTFDASAGDYHINGYSLSAYGNYYILPQLYVDGIFNYGWNNYNLNRSTPGGTAKATPDGTQYSLSAGAGYNFTRGPMTFGPTGRLTYINAHISSYQESGAGQFDTSVDSQSIQSLTTALGGQLTYAISTSVGVLTPLLSFEWVHEFKGNVPPVSAILITDPTVGASSPNNNPDRDYFHLGVGTTATFRRGVSAFLYFEETLGRSNFTNHSFTGGVRMEF